MNVKRMMTAIVGLPLVIAVLVLGNKYIIDFLIAIVAIIGIYEYSKCCKGKAKVISWIGYLIAISIGFVHIIPSDILSSIATLGTPILLVILFLHTIISNMKINFQDISYTLFGIYYICSFLVFIPFTYGIEGEISGKVLIWYIMIASWGTDIFAYIIGKNFGKHYFSKISPNKTIEGCVAGTIASVIISVIYTFFINKYLGYDISYIAIIIIGFILSLIGQIGDFSASVIKRYLEVKDFSELFPGHGGIIDRIDSVMFIAPFAYFLLTMFL